MTGACHSSARYLIVFLVCRFVAASVCSANSKIDECRIVRARLTAHRRQRVANPSIVIECSDRLTTPRVARRAVHAPHPSHTSFIVMAYALRSLTILLTSLARRYYRHVRFKRQRVNYDLAFCQ